MNTHGDISRKEMNNKNPIPFPVIKLHIAVSSDPDENEENYYLIAMEVISRIDASDFQSKLWFYDNHCKLWNDVVNLIAMSIFNISQNNGDSTMW